MKGEGKEWGKEVEGEGRGSGSKWEGKGEREKRVGRGKKGKGEGKLLHKGRPYLCSLPAEHPVYPGPRKRAEALMCEQLLCLDITVQSYGFFAVLSYFS